MIHPPGLSDPTVEMVLPVMDVLGLEVVKARSGSCFRLWVPAFRIRPGEQVALTGVSGCGKSTLLDALAMIVPPTRLQRFTLIGPDGASVAVAPLLQAGRQDRLAALRSRYLGYVLQTGGLLPFLTVERNILLTVCLQRRVDAEARRKVRVLVERLGLERHLHKLPAALSVGERQRVAIARALAPQPFIVLADEPTAALDPVTAREVMGLLVETTRICQSALVVVSHDHSLLDGFGLHRVEPQLVSGHTGMTSIFCYPSPAVP